MPSMMLTSLYELILVMCACALVLSDNEIVALRETLRVLAPRHAPVLLVYTEPALMKATVEFHETSIKAHNISSFIFFSNDARHCRTLRYNDTYCFISSGKPSTSTSETSSLFDVRTLPLVFVQRVLTLNYSAVLCDVRLSLSTNPFHKLNSSDHDVVHAYPSFEFFSSSRGGLTFFKPTSNSSEILSLAIAAMQNNDGVTCDVAIETIAESTEPFAKCIQQVSLTSYVEPKSHVAEVAVAAALSLCCILLCVLLVKSQISTFHYFSKINSSDKQQGIYYVPVQEETVVVQKLQKN